MHYFSQVARIRPRIRSNGMSPMTLDKNDIAFRGAPLPLRTLWVGRAEGRFVWLNIMGHSLVAWISCIGGVGHDFESLP